MDKAGEYLRGTKRLAIIQKWLNGHEDENYEVLPTRKEGKYIVKKREKKLDEKADDEKADDKEIDDKEIDEKESDEKESDEKAEEEEIDEEPEVEPVKPKLRPKPKPKIIPRINNDDSYLIYQILIQLQHITEILSMNREDKERDRMIKQIVNETLRLQEKNRDNKDEEHEVEEIYEQPIQMPIRRRNRIFADMDV